MNVIIVTNVFIIMNLLVKNYLLLSSSGTNSRKIEDVIIIFHGCLFFVYEFHFTGFLLGG